ncbi:LacI family DNA-binding transcriptional regulator [Rhizobiaceae bacterium n13]|uniref:LacI family DNA-binding transcriptional regulator n=1 Tax=Ferirhizobium litorale TaxID=2927786 RepID=A0AAE3QDQ5_9HYPH|nr:LacI family DNA-binding transcriptional regulator [Fererhizobium litorale]MDI7861563.1 LacI family DNA-binding transcriptional regulator [Fererhizobium litorale]MDI7922095.1 LacI family DNA-binding transcriptional regulator [Fererhizobium litorale]
MKGIRQLAEHLEISIGTVSRALNGKPDVNEETRRRVLEAAESLGYVANQSGRALRKGSTGVIGFMMQTGREITGQGDTFFMSVFDGVQTVLARHKLDLVALLCSSEENPDDYLKRIVARGFADGLILSATRRHDSRFELLARRKIPFITLGRSLSDVGQPWIDLDFEGMAETSVERLVARGHRRIAITRPHDDMNLGYVFVDRCRAVLARHGLELADEHIFRSTPNETGGYQIARDLIACHERPTAILLVNEAIATGLYRGLNDAGLIPGRDIAVIGRQSPHSHFLSPRLTSYSLSLRDLGIALAETLLGTMPTYAEIYAGHPDRLLWPMTLLDGESDGEAPAG